jgi:serine/threonine protein kinase/WD40 repeat protein
MGNQLSLQVPSLEFYLADLEEKLTMERSLGFNKFVKTLQCVPSAQSPLASDAKYIVKVYIKKHFTAADQKQAALDAAAAAAAAAVAAASPQSDDNNSSSSSSALVAAAATVNVNIPDDELLDESELIARALSKLKECKRRFTDGDVVDDGNENIATFDRIAETDKAVYVLRPFYHKSLKDRVSSRPFFTADEKLWVVYQMLRALRSSAARKQPHGDLSLENFMVTPTGWVYLLDFACAKPTLLDINNPSVFSFYFDSSNSRRCAIAPERFVPLEQCDTKAPLLHSMDLFSAGCAIFELFTGAPLFNLSTLLQYKRDEFAPVKVLTARIEDERVRRLILTLIDKDPSKRVSAADILATNVELFPPLFAETHAYAKRILFADAANNDADAKADALIRVMYGDDSQASVVAATTTATATTASVAATSPAVSVETLDQLTKLDIGAELGHILSLLDGKPSGATPTGEAAAAAAVSTSAAHDASSATAAAPRVRIDPLIALLLLPIALAVLRHCRLPQSRLRVIALLQTCRDVIAAPLYVGRVLPFGLALLSDRDPVVRQAALRLCVSALECGRVGASAYATHLALDFALPRLLLLGQEENEELVLATLLQQLPCVAKSAKLYLEQQLKFLSEKSEIAYDAELQQLTDALYGMLTAVTGRVPTVVVKRALLGGDILELAIFFGRRKTVDLLVPLLITFLNDASWQLREAFFGAVGALALFVGRDAIESYLFECVYQKALSDSDACVRAAAARCLASLARQGLLRNAKLRAACDVAAQLLGRPELLVRRAAVQLMCDVAAALPLVDRLSFVLPRLAPYCTEPPTLACLASSDVLLDIVSVAASATVVESLPQHQQQLQQQQLYFVADPAAIQRPPKSAAAGGGAAGGPSSSLSHDLQFAYDFESYANLSSTAPLQKKEGGGAVVAAAPAAATASTTPSTSSSEIEGLLVSHFAEHRGAVRCLSVSSDERFFASAGADGSVRVFDCARLIKNIANRARLVVNVGAAASALTTLDGEHALAVGTESGELRVYAIEHQTSADGLMHKYNQARSTVHLAPDEGAITGVASARNSLLAYCTALGAVRTVDLRVSSGSLSSSTTTFALPTRHGTPTSLLFDARDAAWQLVGTSRGRLVLYDRRSALPLWTRAHPLGAPLRRLRLHPGDALRARNGAPAVVYSCADGIVEAVELSNGRVVLALAPNGSLAPERVIGTLPLVASSGGIAAAMPATAAIDAERDSAFASLGDALVTSDDTYGLVLWNVRTPLQSSRALGGGGGSPSTAVRFMQAGPHTFYKESLSVAQPANPHSRANPNSPLVPPSVQHHDMITDLAVLGSQRMLISGARDGVIKVWK